MAWSAASIAELDVQRALRLRTLVQIDSCLSLMKTIVSEAENSREMGEFSGSGRRNGGVVTANIGPVRSLRALATVGVGAEHLRDPARAIDCQICFP